ncbi:N-acetylmuramoyl-L-alanine amidase [Halanaerobium saccharolyticum]|uniref:N-acetylmuramoyl-L-alanine amidase n=1 Tax=Halanaerobium saccharolyticum TaxID=43595 RepID=A0A4R7YYJ4_9FIRM|nr:cell wall hydrolase [Halanaerobium saccharolyticum]RAK06702.1 N-acetylmuramoyl-L-alanine amidase [Halanaerobium saccharolyticum]TDW01339.1 N-acetylmuramoyl-L-alanine amidase [Halanaerobium saccharolyticum]TDX52807.1 N-acetylmuramoyl-L-alanine amidase [Halanaerobium saccharolyticum]
MMLSKRRVLISVMLLLIMVTFVNLEEAAALDLSEFGSRVMRRGDEGIDVAVLQQKLRQLNYYNGNLDGLYGSGTAAAVKRFQKDNGLQVDGVFGESSLAIIPDLKAELNYNISRDDIILLARIIHGEARGEDFKGKVAVGSVILNRINSQQFPNSIRDVILQKGQFSSLMDGQANYYPGEEELQAARAALLGYDPTLGSIYFYNPEIATNTAWISRRNFVTKIGGHVFLR